MIEAMPEVTDTRLLTILDAMHQDLVEKGTTVRDKTTGARVWQETHELDRDGTCLTCERNAMRLRRTRV